MTRARTPADKVLKEKRAERRKVARSGRPVGARNERPREKRVLTPTQKLREHVLIELGVDKKDIADAIGETRQTVSNVFFDLHRSECEAKIVRFLADRYAGLDDHEQEGVNRLFAPAATSFGKNPVTRETMGWPEKSLSAEERQSLDDAIGRSGFGVCGKLLGFKLSCSLAPGHEGWCSADGLTGPISR